MYQILCILCKNIGVLSKLVDFPSVFIFSIDSYGSILMISNIYIVIHVYGTHNLHIIEEEKNVHKEHYTLCTEMKIITIKW